MKSTAIPRAGVGTVPDQPQLLQLPVELITDIAIHTRDVDSMLSFAKTCTAFAAVSEIPSFVAASIDTFVESRGTRIARCDGVETRAARIHQLAGRIGMRLKPRHLDRLVWLLRPKNQAERAQEIALTMQFKTDAPYHARTQAATSSNPEQEAVARATMVFKNRIALLLAALLSGQTSRFDEGLRNFMKQTVSVVWKHPADAANALKTIFTQPVCASEPGFTGHVALGVWLLTQESHAADGYDPRIRAVDLLSWCASLSVAVKIGLMEKIVEWSATCPMPEGAGIAMAKYFAYISVLNQSAETAETLELELARRFFTMLDRAVADFVRYGLIGAGNHLAFAKMLPALPWRNNCKAGLHWLTDALKHHAKVQMFSNTPSSMDQDQTDSENGAKALLSFFGYGRNGPLSVDECKAFIPQGIFTDKELAYLLKSTANGTFSWEALEAVDPQPAANSGTTSAHH